MTTLTEERFEEILKTQIEAVVSPMHVEIQALKADLLHLHNQQQQQREALTTGRALQKNTSAISDEEYKQFAPERIEAASLSEVCEFLAQSQGIRTTNKAEYDAWLYGDRKPSLGQRVRGLTK